MGRSNHSLVPTAASFGWTHIAAAAQRLRYAPTQEALDKAYDFRYASRGDQK
jgi:hypothetical protein